MKWEKKVACFIDGLFSRLRRMFPAREHKRNKRGMDIQFGHTVYGMHEKGLRRVVPHLCFVFVSSQSLLVLYPRPVFHPDFREKRVQFK